MRNELVHVLEATGFPSHLQGTLGTEMEYPESFYTFWNFETPEVHYDNNPIYAVWGFWVNFYSIDPGLVETETNEVIKRLRAGGWTVAGKGEDAASDEPSHTGRRITIYKREIY